MKIFENNEKYEVCKINFVDQNNVLLGYDMEQRCCEDAGWFISDGLPNSVGDKKIIMKDEDLQDYYFDIDFKSVRRKVNEFEKGGIISFRITDGENEKFINIFNAHNGYYSHGFTFKANEIIEGGL